MSVIRHVYQISKLFGGFNYPSEKYESQLGSLFQTEWTDKNHVPNHQPEHNVLNNGTYMFLLMGIHAGPEMGWII